MDKFIKHLWDSNKITIDEKLVLEDMNKEHKGLERLKLALSAYREKWETQMDKLERNEDNIRMHVKYTAQIFLAQWIINSINGGISNPHATNICNILEDSKEEEGT